MANMLKVKIHKTVLSMERSTFDLDKSLLPNLTVLMKV